MFIKVLGSAAGGGVPQWNSNSLSCRLARAGDPRSPRRTQTSLAVSADGHRWFLLNAAPDVRQQLSDTPSLHPKEGARSSPIAGVVLCGAEVDAVAGLLTLREGHAFTLFATQPIHQILDANPIFDVLPRQRVTRHIMEIGQPFPLDTISATVFPAGDKPPLFLELGTAPPAMPPGSSVGILLSQHGRRVAFVPGCIAIDDALLAAIEGADVLLFDGTVWTDDEMPAAGLSQRSGRDMGHMAVAGEHGAIARLRNCGVRRKIFIHINNSNPMLIDGSPERRQCEAAGWEVAFDGMEIDL